MSELFSALFLSLKIATCATLLASLVGIPLAFVMGRARFVGKSVVEAIITLPLVLPPTVVGYLLIVIVGTKGVVGQILLNWFGYRFLFTTEAAVIAAAIVALPLLYMPAKAAFASVPREFEDIARTFGASIGQIFWHVSLPWARRGIVSGVMLGFARALGEFGATVMVFGWSMGRQTLPVLVYSQYEQGEMSSAGYAVALLLGISLLIIFFYNRSPIATQE